jgi:diguanylate cyclase (GGDEF)-like protein
MKDDRTIAWIQEGVDSRAASLALEPGFPYTIEVASDTDAGYMINRLAQDPREVLLIEDTFPFQRTKQFLKQTEETQSRPVVIVLAKHITVPASVSLMESGVFTIVCGDFTAEQVASAVSRGFANRHAFEKILSLSDSLRSSRGKIEKKTIELRTEKVKLRRKMSEVSIMRKVAEWLGNARTLEEGFRDAVGPLCRFVGADSGVFLVTKGEDPWMEVDTGIPQIHRLLLPRDPGRFRKPVFLRLLPDTMRILSPEESEFDGCNAVAFPVRIKRRFLGYGLFWGADLTPPSPATLRLLDGVGVQMGIFSENLKLNVQVEGDRNRLAKVNEELNFLLHLASSLHEDPDMDAVFEWLSAELPRYVPFVGMELLSLTGVPTLRTCGLSETAEPRHLLANHGIPAPGVNLLRKEFSGPAGGPAGAYAGRGESGFHRWEAVLSFGSLRMGVLAANLPGAPTDAGDRLLRAVAAQLSLFLHNTMEKEKVYEMATHDGLTGLYNYRSFRDIFGREFERYLRYGRNLAIMMIDLDNFKRVNDTFGHSVGDKVLHMVADIIRSNLRKTDYGFRYGGDEFVVLLPDRGSSQAEILARRIQAAVKKQAAAYSTSRFALSVSIGIADSEAIVVQEGEELMKKSDGALYKAKEGGRDRIEVADPVARSAEGSGKRNASV